MQPSIWEKQTFFAHQDIIIVGSGFAGLWCALKLVEKKPGCRITILERGLIPTGASTRNAGFSCFGSPSELLADERNFGRDNMLQLVENRFKGLEQIHKRFAGQIDYENSHGYECFLAGDEWEQTITDLPGLNRNMRSITGETETYLQADEKLPELGLTAFRHLLTNKLEGHLHPAKLIQSLYKQVHALGVQVLTGIEVKGYEEENGVIRLTTSEELSFTCDRLLLCTNAFTKELLRNEDIIPARGQVLLTSPVEGLKLKGSFHFDEGFYYFRNLGNCVLLGGARNKSLETEKTTSFSTTNLVQKALENFLSTYILPGIEYTITDRWAGIMGMGIEKRPLIKPVSENVFCAVRMSGMGVALAPVVADEVVTMMG
jgi:gamma-glutamylputrescine oxidase